MFVCWWPNSSNIPLVPLCGASSYSAFCCFQTRYLTFGSAHMLWLLQVSEKIEAVFPSLFFMSLVWSVGASCDGGSRVKFDKFLRFCCLPVHPSLAWQGTTGQGCAGQGHISKQSGLLSLLGWFLSEPVLVALGFALAFSMLIAILCLHGTLCAAVGIGCRKLGEELVTWCCVCALS